MMSVVERHHFDHSTAYGSSTLMQRISITHLKLGMTTGSNRVGLGFRSTLLIDIYIPYSELNHDKYELTQI